ncbi:MAG TPA: DUF1549 and DUF1553 domain-containing protein, partial [Roseimicrobium sp.]|nr:DUF1549 and DUF1553 domain-containing protein [Roseimicrobium sp.]
KLVRNPIDAFIVSALQDKGIAPSAEADKRTLLRRLSLDLTGLPPTLEEMNAFLKDRSSKAYEKQVERLLQSPHFGERMAVWWLDVARFTDTVGFHGDQNQRIFPYRDYVVESFNQNKPFSQFTVEQLAGDLLPNPTREQLIATGFNRLNMMTREGGAQPKEYLAKYGAERVRTVGTAFLGSTFGCAECHDHKYDPISARDFYSLQAFFADVKQWGVYSDYGYTKNPELKGWSNEHPFPPEIEVLSPYLLTRAASIRGDMETLVASTSDTFKKDKAARAALNAWIDSSRTFFKSHPDGWMSPEPSVTLSAAAPAKKAAAKGAAVSKGMPKPDPIAAPFTLEENGRILLENVSTNTVSVTLQPGAGRIASLRLELLPHEKNKGTVLRGGATNSITVKLSGSVQTAGGKAVALNFRHADAAFKAPRYDDGEEVIGIRTGWKTSEHHVGEINSAVWVLNEPLTLGADDVITVKVDAPGAGCVRVSVSPFAPVDVLDAGAMVALSKALKQSGRAARQKVEEAYLLGTGWNRDSLAQHRSLQAKWLECRNGRTWTMVTQASQPLTVRVLPRGNWMDETGPVVDPTVPHFLPQPAKSQGLNRLDLARWMCSDKNPLTPRAVMNRLWKQFYGNGLSMVVDDIGAQGEPPSNLELMDWIAAEFRDKGWDVKHMIRLMVTSATYRQSSSLRPELRDIDPNNRLLASQNPRRLDAEFVRDNALFIAGLINLDIGGPSARPYQPAGYYANLQFPNREYQADTDDQQWRRGLYMHWQRTFLHPMLANFDAPGREECTASRNNSNTPQQALTLLNDPSFVEASRIFAQRLLSSPAKSDEARIDLAFQIALGRPAKDKERASLKQFLGKQHEYYNAHTEDAQKLSKVGLKAADTGTPVAELAAWANVGRVILNLQETITRY